MCVCAYTCRIQRLTQMSKSFSTFKKIDSINSLRVPSNLFWSYDSLLCFSEQGSLPHWTCSSLTRIHLLTNPQHWNCRYTPLSRFSVVPEIPAQVLILLRKYFPDWAIVPAQEEGGNVFTFPSSPLALWEVGRSHVSCFDFCPILYQHLTLLNSRVQVQIVKMIFTDSGSPN